MLSPASNRQKYPLESNVRIWQKITPFLTCDVQIEKKLNAQCFFLFFLAVINIIILRHNENMECKIFLSNRCVFLTDVSQLSSVSELTSVVHVSEFFFIRL